MTEPMWQSVSLLLTIKAKHYLTSSNFDHIHEIDSYPFLEINIYQGKDMDDLSKNNKLLVVEAMILTH